MSSVAERGGLRAVAREVLDESVVRLAALMLMCELTVHQDPATARGIYEWLCESGRPLTDAGELARDWLRAALANAGELIVADSSADGES